MSERVIRVYVVERQDGGHAVVLTSSAFADARTVAGARARQRAERIAGAVAEAIKYAAPEITVEMASGQVMP
jgi:hypothetical protein